MTNQEMRPRRCPCKPWPNLHEVIEYLVDPGILYKRKKKFGSNDSTQGVAFMSVAPKEFTLELKVLQMDIRDRTTLHGFSVGGE